MNYKSALFIVLAFGMVSCQSDKNPVANESFRIQEPKIVLKKTKDQKNFNVVSQQVKPDLTLADELQFQEAEGTFNILYNTNCRFDQKELVNSGYRSNPKTAPFFSFLNAEQLRLIGESRTGAQCAFDFIAINPNGSRHHFKLPLVQMTDDSTANELSILHPKTTDPIQEVIFEKWSEYFLKLARLGASQITINCASGSKTISIDQQDRLNLSSTPLQEINLNWTSGAQSCRIVQMQNSIVVAISKNVVLLSPALNTDFKGAIVHHPRQAYSSFNPDLVSPVYRFEVINTDNRPIYVRLPKQDLGFTGENPGHNFPGFILVQSEDKKSSYEWIQEKIIRVGSKQSLVGYHYTRIDKANCKYMFSGAFHRRVPTHFQIVSENLPQGEPMILKQFEITAYYANPSNGGEHPEVLANCTPHVMPLSHQPMRP